MADHTYIRTTAEPRTYEATPARTAMIRSIYGQMCPGGDRTERALLAIFDVLTPEQQGAALQRLGWEPVPSDVQEGRK